MLGEMLLYHMSVFMLCVAIPASMTMAIPATWLTFERNDEDIRCTTRTCMFFVVPFNIQRVDQVTEIGQRKRAGGFRKNSFSKSGTTHFDGKGFLQIHGAGDQLVEISVSPASLDSVAAKANDFLSSTKESSATIFAIANWKTGGLIGGILSLVTLRYVVGYTLGFLKWIITGTRRIITGPDNL
jgi:hypothetical protein